MLSKESIIIKWQEPVNDGGSPVFGYHVECRQRNATKWNRLNRVLIRYKEYKAIGLKENVEYEIRVFAENLAGCSKPSRVCDGIYTRDPVDPPINVEVKEVR